MKINGLIFKIQGDSILFFAKKKGNTQVTVYWYENNSYKEATYKKENFIKLCKEEDNLRIIGYVEDLQKAVL